MKQIVLSLALLLIACTTVELPSVPSDDLPEGFEQLKLVSVAQEIPLIVEVADEPDERMQGLMYRKNLGKDQGMLFVFDELQVLSFWMKNTLIPLDVLYFDAAGNFVSVQTMNPCTQDPCRTYGSLHPAKYALEVNAEFAKERGVGVGWRMEWD